MTELGGGSENGEILQILMKTKTWFLLDTDMSLCVWNHMKVGLMEQNVKREREDTWCVRLIKGRETYF